MFKGNRGEWSEIYTLIKLLGEEKLHAADENLEKIEDTFFFVKEIIKHEFEPPIKFISNGNIKIIDCNTDEVLEEIPKKKFLENALELYVGIKNGKGRTFEIPEIEEFLAKTQITSLKASSHTTSDIYIKIYDPRTELQPKLGYSIKSLLGGDSTLFNPGPGSNFIYKIRPSGNLDIDEFNKETYDNRPRLGGRINELYSRNAEISFQRIQSDNLYRNLLLIDSDLPEIVSFLLLFRFKHSQRHVSEVTKILAKENPLAYPEDEEREFYTYKIKKMLRDMAMGMTAESKWNGNFEASGGTLVVRDDGEIVCYHIYDIQKFEDYLFNNTYLDIAQTSEDSNNPGHPKLNPTKKYLYGWVYEENEDFFIKLNLQVRYTG